MGQVRECVGWAKITADALDWSLAEWVRKVAPLSMDLEFYMVASAFVAAGLVYAIGLVLQSRRGPLVGPPPLPSAEQAVTWESPAEVAAPYAPPASGGMEPLVQRLGLNFDRVPCGIYRRIDAPLMMFLIGVYMLPLFLDLLGMMGNVEVEVGYEALIGTIITQAFMTALVCGMIVWRMNLVTWLGLRWAHWPWVFFMAPVCVLTTWAFAIGLEGVGYNGWLQSELGGDGQQEVVAAFSSTTDPVLLGLLCFTAVIVAPVSEEILFRGYLYPASKRFIGRVPAILFSALIFAAIHHNAMALLPLCFLALLLAVAYEVSGSIWAPIGIHLLFNAATVGFQLAARWGWLVLPES